MKTHILIGSPHNLFVFDYEHHGVGSAPFTGDSEKILESWVPVMRNTSVAGSTGTLYRCPDSQRQTTVLRGNES